MIRRIKPITVRERRRSTGVFYYHCLLHIILYCYYVILLLYVNNAAAAAAATAYDDPKPATMTTALRTWSLIGQQWVMWYGVMLYRPRVYVCASAEYDDGNYSDVVCAYVYKTRVTGGGGSYEKTYFTRTYSV